MPTPFSHLAYAQCYLQDQAIPEDISRTINEFRPAWFLGNIAADAQVQGNLTRADTHFYEYTVPITEHPWRLMLEENPSLQSTTDLMQRTFVAGYIAHLAIDEYWLIHMLQSQFAEKDWGSDVTRAMKFLALHLMLIYMDERDYVKLTADLAGELEQASAEQPLPFMPEDTLAFWRDFIAQQLTDATQSQTLAIISERVQKSPEELRQMLDSPDTLQSSLWEYVPRDMLNDVEQKMYQFGREQMLSYLQEY